MPFKKPPLPQSPTVYDLDVLERYQQYTREHGSNRAIYFLSRAFLQPFVLGYFSVLRKGKENIPETGPTLVLANHRSFLDPFLVSFMSSWSQPVQFMAKAELFARPRFGWYLSRVGAFPVRRGESDPDALETARTVLNRGGTVVMFIEGTRMRSGGLGTPRKGGARIAQQTGSTIVPISIMGTEKTRRGLIVLPRHCRIQAGKVITVVKKDPTRQEVQELTNQTWTMIANQWLEMGGSEELGSRQRFHFVTTKRHWYRFRAGVRLPSFHAKLGSLLTCFRNLRKRLYKPFR
jgi:1-acyl-sn-glycerol-3-phosphate acyltransferase